MHLKACHLYVPWHTIPATSSPMHDAGNTVTSHSDSPASNPLQLIAPADTMILAPPKALPPRPIAPAALLFHEHAVNNVVHMQQKHLHYSTDQHIQYPIVGNSNIQLFLLPADGYPWN